jgi:hypothetical protein
MKKTLLVAVFVGLAIFAFATTGVVYAQTDTPTVPDEETPRFQMFGRGSFGMRLHAMADRGSGLLHDYMHPALAEAFGLTPLNCRLGSTPVIPCGRSPKSKA